MGGVIPSEDAFNRFSDATKHYEQTYRNRVLKTEPRRVMSACPNRNEVWQIIVFGTPGGGSFDLDVTVDGTEETLTIDYDFTPAEVKTEFATHSKITTDDIETSGGTLPGSVVNLEFLGDLKHRRFSAPGIDFTSLSGGSGVGVVVARWQPGYPIDGSA